jgi:aldehyde dehydrogenase (NAD+)
MSTSSPETAESLQQLVDGKWVAGGGGPIVSTNPARPDEVVAQGAGAAAADVDAAIRAAHGASPLWAATPAHQRAAVLDLAAALLQQRAAAHGLELAREEGKTRAEGVAEVRRAAQILRYYAAQADQESGSMFTSLRPGERILVERVPVGVIGVITPFNFPIAIPAWKIAPALAYGNTVVWKPAAVVPLLAVRLGEALLDAGLPAGVLNLLIGDGHTGQAVVEHPLVSAVSFTGSTAVGRTLMALCGGLGKPVQTEMGGKNAAVVLADADLEAAADMVVSGAFASTGQKCTATSRLVVEDLVADPLLEAIGDRLDRWRSGDPLDPATDMGPMVSEEARAGVLRKVEAGLTNGVRVVHGEPGLAREGQGWFMAPIVVEVSTPSPGLWTEELFGPVLTVVRASDPTDAFALANDSEFGLSASVFTNDLTRVTEAMAQIDVGVLHVNSETTGADPHVPFGGSKASGFGPHEQGPAAREFYTRTKTVYLKGLG